MLKNDVREIKEEEEDDEEKQKKTISSSYQPDSPAIEQISTPLIQSQPEKKKISIMDRMGNKKLTKKDSKDEHNLTAVAVSQLPEKTV